MPDPISRPSHGVAQRRQGHRLRRPRQLSVHGKNRVWFDDPNLLRVYRGVAVGNASPGAGVVLLHSRPRVADGPRPYASVLRRLVFVARRGAKDPAPAQSRPPVVDSLERACATHEPPPRSSTFMLKNQARSERVHGGPCRASRGSASSWGQRLGQAVDTWLTLAPRSGCARRTSFWASVGLPGDVQKAAVARLGPPPITSRTRPRGSRGASVEQVAERDRPAWPPRGVAPAPNRGVALRRRTPAGQPELSRSVRSAPGAAVAHFRPMMSNGPRASVPGCRSFPRGRVSLGDHCAGSDRVGTPFSALGTAAEPSPASSRAVTASCHCCCMRVVWGPKSPCPDVFAYSPLSFAKRIGPLKGTNGVRPSTSVGPRGELQPACAVRPAGNWSRVPRGQQPAPQASATM